MPTRRHPAGSREGGRFAPIPAPDNTGGGLGLDAPGAPGVVDRIADLGVRVRWELSYPEDGPDGGWRTAYEVRPRVGPLSGCDVVEVWVTVDDWGVGPDASFGWYIRIWFNCTTAAGPVDTHIWVALAADPPRGWPGPGEAKAAAEALMHGCTAGLCWCDQDPWAGRHAAQKWQPMSELAGWMAQEADPPF